MQRHGRFSHGFSAYRSHPHPTAGDQDFYSTIAIVVVVVIVVVGTVLCACWHILGDGTAKFGHFEKQILNKSVDYEAHLNKEPG